MTAWTPPALTSCVLTDWWDVSDAATVTQSSGWVSQIDNKVSGGFHLEPTYAPHGPAYSATSMNGYPGFETDGSSTYLQTSGYWASGPSQPFWWAFLVKVVALPASGSPGVSGGEPGWNGCRLNIGTTGGVSFYAGGAADYSVASGLAAGDYAMLLVVSDGTSTFASLNGTAVGGSPNPGTSYQGGFTFGCDQYSTFSNLVFCEMLAGTGTPDSADKACIEAYPLWRRNLQALLPSGHTWKSSAPSTGGAGGATYSPGPGSIALSGKTPVLSATQNLTPTAGAVALVGQTPALSGTSNLTPPAGTLALAGKVPALSATQSLSPPAGGLTFTGLTPTLSGTSNLTPPAGALAFTGYPPSLSPTSTYSPPAGALAFTGLTPSLTQTGVLSPPAGAVALSGQTPTLSGTSNLTPPAGAAAFTGLTPALTLASALTPPAGALTFTGRVPSLAGVQTLSPPAGAMTFIGYTPALVGPVITNLSPPTGAIAFLGRTPRLQGVFPFWTAAPATGETWAPAAAPTTTWTPAA